MSLLKESLSGKYSTIVYRRYLTHPTIPNQHMALIRFEIDGWSSVFFALGRTRYLAGARALQKYSDFCRSHDVTYLEDGAYFQEGVEGEPDYCISDDAYADPYTDK